MPDSPLIAPVPVFLLRAQRPPLAVVGLEEALAELPSAGIFQTTDSPAELAELVQAAPLAVVVLCIGAKVDLLQALEALNLLQAGGRVLSLKVLSFNSIELTKVHALLRSKGSEVIPYSLSARGLLTKLDYNLRLLASHAAPRPAHEPERWIIHQDVSALDRENPWGTTPLHADTKGVPEVLRSYVGGGAAFSAPKLGVRLFPEMDAGLPSVSAELLEYSDSSFVLDVARGQGRVGGRFLAELFTEGQGTVPSRFEIRVLSIEPGEDGHQLLLASIVNGNQATLRGAVRLVTDRQQEIQQFLEDVRGF